MNKSSAFFFLQICIYESTEENFNTGRTAQIAGNTVSVSAPHHLAIGITSNELISTPIIFLASLLKHGVAYLLHSYNQDLPSLGAGYNEVTVFGKYFIATTCLDQVQSLFS